MAPNIKISYLLSRSFRFFIRYPDSDMLVLSTRSIMWIGHRKEIRKLIFEHKPFVGANRGIVGCACSICKKMELRYWLVPGNVKYNRIWSDAQRKMIGREIWTKKHWTELIIKLVTSAYSCLQFLWPETLRGQIVYRFWPSIFLLLIVDHYAIYNICKCCSCREWTGWKCQVCIHNLCIPFKLFKICFSGQT